MGPNFIPCIITHVIVLQFPFVDCREPQEIQDSQFWNNIMIFLCVSVLLDSNSHQSDLSEPYTSFLPFFLVQNKKEIIIESEIVKKYDVKCNNE